MNAVPVAIGCFVDSTSFEDAIRRAILVGGDSDTIGAIVGSLAEAHYGVPKDLFKQALSFLPEEMKEIVAQFYLRKYS
jgi:ADP-ribosylglycohydrolase